MKKYFSEKEALDDGLIQLYEYQTHTNDEEDWMLKEQSRIHLNPKRKSMIVKKGIFITLFVDDRGKPIAWQ
jgi:hypothetical protein